MLTRRCFLNDRLVLGHASQAETALLSVSAAFVTEGTLPFLKRHLEAAFALQLPTARNESWLQFAARSPRARLLASMVRTYLYCCGQAVLKDRLLLLGKSEAGWICSLETSKKRMETRTPVMCR